MFNATHSVKIATDCQASYSQRRDANSALKKLVSFDFVFILHMMQQLMEYTDKLCWALQHKSQDILNAMDLVVGTKSLIQKFRDSGWEDILQKILVFCNKHETLTIIMNATYSDLIRSQRNKDVVSFEHHYRVDIFITTMDQQLQEINGCFREQSTNLLILSTSLNPKGGYKNFNIENICRLVEKYYSVDFSIDDKDHLKVELELFYCDIPNHAEMKNLTTISDLCCSLVESGKSFFYQLVDRLIQLIWTLPVSTATTESAFLAMKIVKTSLRNKMEDDFLSDYLIVYIERKIAEKFTNNFIINNFDSMKPRRARLH